MGFRAETKTGRDGSYEFNGLQPGEYSVTPLIGSGLDFDHEYEEWYKPTLTAGQCANVSFLLEPSTRIRGHVRFPEGFGGKSIEVVAIPTKMTKLNRFSGKWDFTDKGRFDLWPLPPGDYYVGVNITSSPKKDSPFPPTYYPGVASQNEAEVVHIAEGEIRELELKLPGTAKTRQVHFTATGLDGKPMRHVYVQPEDLRHPGDAVDYVNADLNEKGGGNMTVYADFDYHLHASQFMSYGNYWCAKPVTIQAGREPVEARFVMDRSDRTSEIREAESSKD